MKLLIVESPSKAKTIEKYLKGTFTVRASVGHIRDLPSYELGVDVDNNFEPKVARVRTGETVRFVNNSTAELNLCGTAFTSCKDLKPGEYWEFNFATVGTWTFENKSNPNMIGTMVVQ